MSEKVVYKLTMFDSELCSDGDSEAFVIGYFETEDIAGGVAQYYLENIRGFMDYPCEYRVEAKQIIEGCYESENNEVWIVWGYNCDDKGDEVDIIESLPFNNEEGAEAELQRLQSDSPRDEWGIDKYVIGEKCWSEGFVRV